MLKILSNPIFFTISSLVCARKSTLCIFCTKNIRVYNDNSVKASKDAGYSLSYTTNRGLSDREDNSLALDRIYVSSTYNIDQFKEVLSTTAK